MSHEKRFLLAIGLTVAFLFVWFQYFVPKPAPQPPTTEATPVETAMAQAGSPAPAKPAGAPSSKRHAVAPAVETVLGGELWNATLTSRSASIASMELTRYKTQAKPDAPRVKVIPIGGAAGEPLVFSFDVAGQALSDADLAYAVVEKQEDRVVYQAQAGDVTIRKTWDLRPQTYVSALTVEVMSGSKDPKKVAASVSLEGALTEQDHQSGGFFKPRHTPMRAVSYVNGQSHHWVFSDVQKGAKVPEGDISWAGFDSQYFLLAALPSQGRWERLSVAVQPDGERVQETFSYPTWDLAPGQTLRYAVDLYAGPKDIDQLQAAGANLDRAIDLGDWLGLVARPMMKFLRWAHGWAKNYGLAIILLTVLVRLLLTPFTQMQAKSMKRMQEHKPEMDALKERYKDDKEAYSRELMAYMRTHKINPMGGCLLLLPQLPIFFALYRVLYNSIELRHEPFVFWIRDLAAHDPYFVMPVLLGIAMFFQQKLTPNPSADESQQMIMKIMPVMFTVFMLFLPAGLNLYILVSTLWGVAQQYRIQKATAGTVALRKAG